MGNFKIFHKYISGFTWNLPLNSFSPNSSLAREILIAIHILYYAKEIISGTFTQAHIWQLCYLKPQVEYKQL